MKDKNVFSFLGTIDYFNLLQTVLENNHALAILRVEEGLDATELYGNKSYFQVNIFTYVYLLLFMLGLKIW